MNEAKHTEDVTFNFSEALLNDFRQTLNYGFEDTYVTPQNTYELAMRDSFFEQIYVSRPIDEEVISVWMEHHANDLGRIVGPQGCGKSTLIKSTERIPPEDTYPVIHINVRIFWERTKDIKPNAWRKIIETAVKGTLSDRYFKKERIDHFFSYFLFEDPKAEETFVDELNSINRLHLLSLSTEESEHNLHISNQKEWFEKYRQTKPELVKICGDISRRLSLKHYIIAAYKKAPYIKHFNLVLDNVDCVPRDDQYSLYNIAEEFSAIHVTSCNLIIVTRKETCSPPQEVCIVNATPIITLGEYIPEEENDERGLSESVKFTDVLDKRLNFFLNRNGGGDYESRKALVYLAKRLGEMFNKEKSILLKLANQSIRDSLRYLCDFLRDLIAIYPGTQLKEVLDSTHSKDAVLSSFYGWLTKYGDVLRKQHLNLVELLKFCRERHFIGTKGCDVSYLILACVYNFRRENGRNPLSHEIVGLFGPLGYTEEDVLEALCALWNLHNIDFGQVLSIYQHPLPKSFKEIKDNAEIELNHRGAALLRIVSVSFMFTARLLYTTNMDFFYPKQDRDKITHFYDIKNISLHLKNITKFLFELADLHVLELHKIRTGYNNNDWFKNYLRYFGIDRKLQIERVVESIESFASGFLSKWSPLEESDRNEISRYLDIQRALARLYRDEVDSFKLENISDTRVRSFNKIYKYLIKTPYNPDIILKISFYNKAGDDFGRDIKHLLQSQAFT